MHEKEYATCPICRKYKGCWTDSGVCSDCDEAEDERKIRENEGAEEGEQVKTAAIDRKMTASDRSHEVRLLDKVRGAKAAVNGPFMFAGVRPAPQIMLTDAKAGLSDFYRAVAARR